MNRILLALAGGATTALALVACNPPHPRHHSWAWGEDSAMKTIAKLECPDEEGDLTRKSQAADGKACVYTTDDGTTVTLQLLALTGGSAEVALAPIEADLKSELPPEPTNPDHDKGQVDINLPGVHIHADGKDAVGGKGEHGHASVRLGLGEGAPKLQVNAQDHGAEIHVDQSLHGIKLSVIHASDVAGPHGYRLVGYEARGPSAGPVVVAVVKSKTGDHDAFHDSVRTLLENNIGD